MIDSLAVRIVRLQPEGRNCVRLRLAPAEADQLLPPFTAGSHIDVVTPSGITRQYSLIGNPVDQEFYEICVKHEPTSRGGSASLCHHTTQNSCLTISKPRNTFTLPDRRKYILVAGGIGITPLVAMAHQLHDQGKEWCLYYYVREIDNAPLQHDLAHENLAPHVMFRKSLKDGHPEELTTPDLETAIMLCGPDGFMTSVIDNAVENGWKPSQIFTESFAPQPLIAQGEGFDVILSRSGRTIRVLPEQTIATALIDAGIDVTLSCEQGMCGACVIGFEAGTGDHRDMVLTPEEQQHSIAICCSRASTPSLTLTL